MNKKGTKRLKQVTTQLTRKRLAQFVSSAASKGRTAFTDEIKLCLRFFRTSIQGSYTKWPWRMFLGLTFGLIYFISPIDFVIDFIPFIGFMDDVTVVALIMKFLAKDIKKFKEWEQKQEMESLRSELREAEKQTSEK